EIHSSVHTDASIHRVRCGLRDDVDDLDHLDGAAAPVFVVAAGARRGGAGGSVGGLTGGHGPAAVVGAVGGAAVGAAASQGGAEHRTYEVFVRFDDGGQQV